MPALATDELRRPATLPGQGFGLGLRTTHYEEISRRHAPQRRPRLVTWFEILTENYLVPGGKPMDWLHRIRADYPVVMHGVSMSVGSTDPIDWDYLRAVKALAERVSPLWISDHLCWTGVAGRNLHDLLPLPYTEEALCHVVSRVQAAAGVPRATHCAGERLQLRQFQRRGV